MRNRYRYKHRFRPSLDSNRNGHLTAAIAASILVTGTAIIFGNLNLLTSAIAITAWEIVATPDMDHNSRRPGRGAIRFLWVMYWRPYAVMVAHRSPISHSLLIGLPLRLAYVFAVPVLAIASFSFGTLLAALPFAKWILLGCAIADVVHLAKDGYRLPEMFFGQNS